MSGELAAARRPAGRVRPGPGVGELAELRDAKKRIRLLVERDRLVRHRTAVLNQMRDLVLTAPDELRGRLRKMN
ncbi:MAG: hypothetical protein M3O32_00645 [Actinomycetota bacterium]|nr:hypothetical protein [Actinomycetota bacterium]